MHIFKESQNSKLISLLNDWGENPSGKNYDRVTRELVKGHSYLMLPSINNEPFDHNWIVSETDPPLQLTCIFEVDGVKVLGAFTDNKSMYHWSKKPTPYLAILSQVVLEMCEKNNIYKIIINSGSPNIFLAQRPPDKG
jgi:hypothetical protein